MINPFNLRDFGVVGNGVADDTSSIQNAINTAFNAGGGMVYAPRGTYLAGQLTLKANVSLVGEGIGATTFTLKNGANQNFFIGTNATNCAVRDLTINANRTNQVGTNQWNGIALTTSDYTNLSRVEIKETNRNGISLLGCQRCLIDRCYVHDTNYIGIWTGYSGATESNNTVVRNCTVVDTGLDNILVDSNDILVEGNHCLRGGVLVNDTSCIYVEPGSIRIRIIGNHTEGSTGFGIDIGVDPTGFHGHLIVGNVCVRNREAGIQTRSPGTAIVGNYCADNGQVVGGFTPTRPYGMHISGGSDIAIVGNVCTDTQGTKTQTYGINLVSTPARVAMNGNVLSGNSTGAINGTLGTDAVRIGNTNTGGLFSNVGDIAIGGGVTLTKALANTATFDPPSTANGAIWTTTVPVTGAVVGDMVLVNLSTLTTGGWALYGYVSAADTVTVIGVNHTGSTVDLTSGTLRVLVFQGG